MLAVTSSSEHHDLDAGMEVKQFPAGTCRSLQCLTPKTPSTHSAGTGERVTVMSSSATRQDKGKVNWTWTNNR